MEQEVSKWQKGWSFENELDYVKGLISRRQTVGPDKRPLKLGVKRLLQNYIGNAKKRVECGTYVKGGEEIIAFAQKAMRGEEDGE